MSNRGNSNSTIRCVLIALFLVGAFCHIAQGELRLAKIFSDHMVVQQELPLRIWGWADANAEVSVQLADAEATTVADAAGHWLVTLAPQQATGKSVELRVSSHEEKLVCRDVLLGEVWVCGGQSNMGRPVNGDQIRQAETPQIRLFNSSGNTLRDEGIDDVFGWAICSPESIAHAGDGTREKGRRGFTEVGYVFGKAIHQTLQVPIGLVQMNCGGSTAKDWTPTEGVRETLEVNSPVQKLTHKPGVLYEVRMRGIVPLTTRGVIWYQGEDDGRNKNYAKDLSLMIAAWRKLFRQPELPFYMSQIAQTTYASGMLKVWEDQVWVANNVQHTGLASSNDLQDKGMRTDTGNPGQGIAATGWPLAGGSNPHPPNKHRIGERLAGIALTKTYGRKSTAEVHGPMYDSHEVRDGKVWIRFKHVGAGLRTDDNQPLNWFQTAPPLGREDYHPSPDHYVRRLRKQLVKVRAEIVAPDKVVIELPPAQKEPFWISFAWHPLARHNLYNSDGLAAFPFRIWPGVPPAPSKE